MKKFLPFLFLGAASFGVLSGCGEDDETTPQTDCVQVTLLGQSCNGTLLQLPTDVPLGKTVTIEGVSYANVVATYSETPALVPEAKAFWTGLRLATNGEVPARACIATLVQYDVDQVILSAPKCKGTNWCGTVN